MIPSSCQAFLFCVINMWQLFLDTKVFILTNEKEAVQITLDLNIKRGAMNKEVCSFKKQAREKDVSEG